MNFHCSQIKPQETGSNLSILEPRDLNFLTSGLKSREENIIELFDRNLKQKDSFNKKEINKLQAIQIQYQINEMEREKIENDILKKYQNSEISDEKQKK